MEKQNNPQTEAGTFFEQTKPLDSFADVDAKEYVRVLRTQSRIFRAIEEAPHPEIQARIL